jgi:siroheme synthase
MMRMTESYSMGERPTEAPEPRDGWVAFVGAGPGDDALMTLRGARLLGAADLVIAEAEVADRVSHLLTEDTTVTEPSSEIAGTTKALVQAAKAGQFVVRLVAGDPLLSGAAAEVQACAKALVRYEIVPGVPAATGVPAYAGIALPADSAGELRVVHANEVSQVAYAAGTLVVLGAETAPADLGKMLIAAGWPDTTPFAITWDGTTTDQQTVATTLGRIGPDRRHHPRRRGRRRRRGGGREEPAVLVRDQAAVRLARAGAADQGTGVRGVRAAPRVRCRARGGADHRGRAAAHTAANGACRQGPGHRPVPVGRVHLDQRGQGGTGEA